MAGDWLKMEHSLPEKPEILAISAKLDMHPDMVVGMCFRLWRWFDIHTEDGHAPAVTFVTLSSALGHADVTEKFLKAMQDVSWLTSNDQGLVLPNFDYHNGNTAKTRALGSKRKKKQRSKQNNDVTKESRNESDKIVTREEKRREENIINDQFEVFYSAYPKKVAKPKALKAWQKQKPILQVVLKSLEAHKKSSQWQNKEFIPHPATFINNQRWEDEIEAPSNSYDDIFSPVRSSQ
jgi:hypothetical protein